MLGSGWGGRMVVVRGIGARAAELGSGRIWEESWVGGCLGGILWVLGWAGVVYMIVMRRVVGMDGRWGVA